GLAISEHCCGDIGIRIAGSEERRGDPCDVHTWKLDSVSDDCASFGCNLRRLHVWLCDGLPALEWPKVFFHQRLRCGFVDVADDRNRCVVRRVVALEELLHIFQLCRLDVGMRTPAVALIRMILREEL